MKRFFDLLLAALATCFLALPAFLVALAVWITSPGPIIYWSERIGRYNKPFSMPKFRTMNINSPVVASHLLINPHMHLTIIGGFLRKSSLDELPQLWSIFAGNMSFVGPRPSLFNQYDLIEMRTKHDIHKLLPGLTGWAQINGRDALSTQEKIYFDMEYLKHQSLFFDIKILWLTLSKVIRCDKVFH